MVVNNALRRPAISWGLTVGIGWGGVPGKIPMIFWSHSSRGRFLNGKLEDK